MIKDRAQQMHGKVCAIETRGPKRSLFLSVYSEPKGTRYVLRRNLYGGVRGDFEVLNILVRS